MKPRSTNEFTLSDYCFAVCPVSLQYDRAYKTKFHLYFQKNLQIISKHESPLAEVKKEQIVEFSIPQPVKHFRIQCQKNLEYHWSLYIFRVDKQIDNEQFVEGQKISLKDECDDFRARGVNLFEQSIRFNVIRCKLSYVVIIGNNNRQVVELAQRYFNDNKMSSVTTDQKLINEPQRVLKIQTAEDPQDELNRAYRQQDNLGQGSEGKMKNNAEQLAQIIQNLENIKISEIIYKGRNTLQSQQENNFYDELLTPREEQNPKLSNSELEIGKQIQEIVNYKQKVLRRRANILQQSRKMGEVEERLITMTCSQILNDKREVILPIYKQKKFLISVLCFLLIVLGMGIQAFITSSSIGEQKRGKRVKKEKESNKEFANKRVKGKK